MAGAVNIKVQIAHLEELLKALSAGPHNTIPANFDPALKVEDLDVTYHERHVRAAVKKGCPKCGHEGQFVKMALCCPQHGAFGGC